MADKAYMIIKNMKADKVFDNKYKATLPKTMKTAAEKAIKGSSNMTLDKPNDKNAKAYSLDATVVSLTNSGKELQVKVSMALSENNSMFGFLEGNSKYPTGNPKQLDRDVQDLVGGVIESLVDGKVSGAIQKKLDQAP
ncbi:MAG TPA: hypothetical protein VFE51_28370 [Verrucomicrobiae bacterium]|nr:hypothetical protein [Verrucomicrobiae bacterium]